MKSWLMLFLLLHCPAILAQSVYMTPGEKGPVFSDKAQPGAKEVNLPPLNVIAPLPVAAPAVKAAASEGEKERARPEASALAYRSLAIVQPENYGSMLANTALFEVRVAVDPPLQLGAGHAFAVSIDGRAVDLRFTTSEFSIPPEFWGDLVPSSGQSLQLDARIVDSDGREIRKADPVRFFMRYPPRVYTPPRPPRPAHPRPSTPAVLPAVGAAR